jgi:hypothetical protein
MGVTVVAEIRFESLRHVLIDIYDEATNRELLITDRWADSDPGFSIPGSDEELGLRLAELAWFHYHNDSHSDFAFLMREADRLMTDDVGPLEPRRGRPPKHDYPLSFAS